MKKESKVIVRAELWKEGVENPVKVLESRLNDKESLSKILNLEWSSNRVHLDLAMFYNGFMKYDLFRIPRKTRVKSRIMEWKNELLKNDA